MTRTLSRLTLTAIVVLALAPLGAAEAKAPPKGKYTCTIYSISIGTQFAGTIRIFSKGRYSVNDGKKGKFKTKGRKIIWKTGDYRKAWRSKWTKTKGNPPVIYHYFRDDKAYESAAATCSYGK